MLILSLITGAIVSFITGSLILASLAHNPRIWLNDAPQAMQDEAEPLNMDEKRLRTLWAIPILFSMMALIPITALWINQSENFTYLEGVMFLWIAWMIFNLVDLIIIDWLIVVWWQPTWTQLPNLEHLSHHNNYRFHFQGFVTGSILITVISVIFALIFLVL